MRAFFAINLPNDIKEELRQFQAKLRIDFKNNNVTWVRPEIMHITMLFLGDIRDSAVENFSPLLDAETSELGLGGFCAFPNKYNPRVLIMEVCDEAGLLPIIHQMLKTSMKEFHVSFDAKPFRSHITIGGVKEKLHVNLHHSPAMQYAPSGITWMPDSVDLMKSTLTASGPQYTVLKRFSL